MKVVGIPVLLVTCLSGCGGNSGAAHEQSGATQKPDITHVKTLRGPDFKTSVPAGWHERRLHDHEDNIYFSGSAKLTDNLGLAPGGIGISIANMPTAQAHNPTSAVQAIKKTVGTPQAATEIALAKPPRAAVLAGSKAATVQFTYRYQGAQDVQSDLAAIHGNKLVVIEVNSDQSLQPLAQRVMSGIVAHWRWVRPAKAAAGRKL